MESQNFKEIFEKTCFQISVGELIKQTGEILQENPNLAMDNFVEPLHGFLSLLLEEQKCRQELQIKHVCISFLRSAMYVGSPVLFVEAYQNIPFLEKPVLTQELDAAWIFPCWKQYRRNMEERIRQQSLGRYVREPERKSYDSRAVSVMLRYLALYLKYMARQLEYYPEWKELEQTKDFIVSYGEYMDWQFPLIRIREEMDPFLWDDKEEMTFRKFQSMVYENKEFPDWTMDDCVFQECTFRNTTFEGTRFRTVRFLDCIFEDCRFQGVEFGGSSVSSSHVKNTTFQSCRFLDGFYQQGKSSVFYPACTFRWSLLESVHWEETPRAETMFVDCQVFDETEEYEEKVENEIFYDTAGSADV